MAGDETLLHIRSILLLLWLKGFLFFSGWSLDEPSKHHSSPEVVIPLRLSGTGKHMKASGWLCYSLHFGGQRHIVHMKVKKSFLARNLPVFTYTEQGALHEEQPFIQNDCYYHGYVEGDPESLVVLSTCFRGFQGMLKINDTTYEIKPKMFSATFEHLVYKMGSEETQFPPMRCGLTEEVIERQLKLQRIGNYTLRQSSYEGWWTHVWTIEMAIIVDHNRYVTLDSNETKVQQEVLNVLNLVDSLYQPLEVDIFLAGMEVWTNGNVLTHDNMEYLLVELCRWKRTSGYSDRIRHDVVHLILDKSFGIFLGLAFVGEICTPAFNCATLSFRGYNLVSFANSMAHELGHNLGMTHDEEYCKCADPECIMYPTKTASTKFSNCSYSAFWNVINIKTCMRNRVYPLMNAVSPKCGNNVVEIGEACDCGTVKSCEGDPCCRPDCSLAPRAVCAFGGCCQNCRFMSSGTVCRAAVNECDLPEWCDGSTYQCREDVYLQNGTPCPGNGYCYEKTCVSRDEQCRKIFGNEARSADEICYVEINTRGDRFGHCGMNENDNYRYIRCEISDSHCGRIQCENVSEIPLLSEHSTVHTINFGSVTCWGTDYHFGMTIPDIGVVNDGSKCGREKICVHRKCVVLEQYCSSNNCHDMGVCNNKKHCHCVAGRAPPNCYLNGSGGSIDSGPPPGTNTNKGKVVEKEKSFLPLLGIIPLLALLLCLLIFFCMRPRKEESSDKEDTNESES
ncbi:disintegrin and metalloproteinase domain-containing protein 20-like [Dasypus novemcinctus]|uniref:disintegrin and metalloproteinase domain-containing protein 20-like n=1 Tax=Dasypus novemcinctus TaxID=9361 RepID=UPI00265E9713|nr:disintegrin and metalloproteinase domain-containing protein 20-like [Dasypus novemcinctus]